MQEQTKPHPRARTRAAVVALVVATTLGALGGPARAQEAAEPDAGVTVTPSTGLLDGHVVTITATGLTPGERYWMSECDPDGTCDVFQDIGGRPFVPPYSSLVTASASGTATSRIELFRSGCLPDGCVVRVMPLMGGAPLATAPLSFAAEGSYQWPQAGLTVRFGEPVVERTLVSVEVTGMSPWRKISPSHSAVASIDVCKDDGELTGSDCYRGLDLDAGRVDAAAIGGSGAGGGEVRLLRHLPNHPGWDCAIDGCVMVVTQDGDDVVVGNPRTAAVPITYAPEWAPFPSRASFIDRAITGVLGRAPTRAGRARLEAGLPNRSITGVQALVEAAASSRLDADVGEVVRLYRASFGRAVETGGLIHWVRRLRSGLTPLGMARSFGATAEFEARYASLSDAEAVALTYTTVLGRQPSPSELEYWVGRMEAGLTTSDLVYSFARSAENRSRTNRAVWSTIVVFRLNGLAPSAAQLAGGPHRAAADALALSVP